MLQITDFRGFGSLQRKLTAYATKEHLLFYVEVIRTGFTLFLSAKSVHR